MYPNDNRYPQDNITMTNSDNINIPMYQNQMRPGIQMMNHRPSYYQQPGANIPNILPPYDYMPPNYMMPPLNQVIEPSRYHPNNNWRQNSQNNRNSMLPPHGQPHNYYERPSLNQPYSKLPPMNMHINYPQHPSPYQTHHQHHFSNINNIRSTHIPQMNILQRLSFIIKPQLPQLKKIMSKITIRKQKKRQKSRQRSRSRSYDKNKKSSEWVCKKCSFLNYDWRQKCKKCNQNKPSKSFAPGPEDWQCSKCGNLNYARRYECNRCKTSRPK